MSPIYLNSLLAVKMLVWWLNSWSHKLLWPKIINYRKSALLPQKSTLLTLRLIDSGEEKKKQSSQCNHRFKRQSMGLFLLVPLLIWIWSNYTLIALQIMLLIYIFSWTVTWVHALTPLPLATATPINPLPPL